MTIEMIREVLGWCAIINMGFLLVWGLMILLAGGWIYRLHSRWFPMSREQFDVIHYAGIALYKVGFFLFNLVPYIALCIVG
jgi:hypothetical protein